MFSSFIRDESGSAAVSYGMVVSLIILAAILVFVHIGNTLTGTFQSVTPSQEITSLSRNQGSVTEVH